jgi:hypothetical protein
MKRKIKIWSVTRPWDSASVGMTELFTTQKEAEEYCKRAYMLGSAYSSGLVVQEHEISCNREYESKI